jgi:plasmid stability protein
LSGTGLKIRATHHGQGLEEGAIDGLRQADVPGSEKVLIERHCLPGVGKQLSELPELVGFEEFPRPPLRFSQLELQGHLLRGLQPGEGWE